MAAVGIATATAGIMVGTVTLTGIGLVMTEIVEFLSGGNIVIMLVLVGVICIILGTGLPTTASYVVVATLDGAGRGRAGRRRTISPCRSSPCTCSCSTSA